MKEYFVYILASHKFGTLYVGVTSNLENRMNIHQSSTIQGTYLMDSRLRGNDRGLNVLFVWFNTSLFP